VTEEFTIVSVRIFISNPLDIKHSYHAYV